ncbi:MAG: glutamate synthase large subunit, partial [Alphaproteobacteria bacterium]|nr:glutamate synthase large subunit [Alphaproteobacteria bacterium]
TVLYAATAGRLFAAGQAQAGERFYVRNSGAEAMVEDCGSNGCEYMTGGTVAILGAVGDRFAAGMTGGIAFVYDEDGRFADRVNPADVFWQRIAAPEWETRLRGLVEAHVRETRSRFAEKLLADWERETKRFWQIVPKERLGRLPHPVADTSLAVPALARDDD